MPTLVRLERPPKLFPGESAPVHHHVIRTAELSLLAPDEPPGGLVSMDDPPGPVRVRLEVAAGDLLLGAVPDEGDQLPDVGVMGAEHGKVVTLCDPGLLELDLDARRCPPDPVLELMEPAVSVRHLDGLRRFRQLGITGERRHAPVRTAVAERHPAEGDAGTGGAAVLAQIRVHGARLGAMDAKEQRSMLRSAVYRGDGRAVVALAPRAPGSDDALQLLGDGLAAALAQDLEGAAELALACAGALRERGFYGDDDLADHLEALAGKRAPLPLVALPVDLDDLATVLEGDPIDGGGRIDRRTGEVWHRAAVEYAREIGEEDEESAEDPERWLWVGCEGSHEAYRDMELFIGTVADPERADRLAIAIDGRGAFRRFKDVLGRWPGEIERWYAFSEERQRGRARAWLAGAGYCVEPAGRLRPEG